MVGQKSIDLRPLRQAADRPASPRAAQGRRRRRARRSPASPSPRSAPGSSGGPPTSSSPGRSGETLPGGHDQGGGDRGGPDRRPIADRRHARRASTSCPGKGIDFSAARRRLLLVVLALYAGSALLGFLQGYLLNDVVQKHGVPAARRGRGQAEPAAAALFRPPASRRVAEQGHQRHRQRLAQTLQQTMSQVAHLAADHRLRGRHDVLDLADAGADRPGDHPGERWSWPGR